MIDQKEGETEMAVKVHYDNMVSKRRRSSPMGYLMFWSISFCFYRDVLQLVVINTFITL